jgi:uncharacterized membrane protein
MMAVLIDRKRLKADTKSLLSGAQVSPKAMTALYLGIFLVLDLLMTFLGEPGVAATFISILVSLLVLILKAGLILYCMDIRRGHYSGYLTLFDGFSLAGKIIALHIVTTFFIFLWSMLFVIPGLIAGYRYRFALYNLLENPELGVFEALNMSKQQTMGYKVQLFMLDLSYIGWTILASLPATIYSSSLQIESLQAAMASTGFLTSAPIEFATAALLPLWIWVLISDLWNLVVSMFYLPAFQCVELGYFEIAKETSGVGSHGTPNNFTEETPDNTDPFQ